MLECPLKDSEIIIPDGVKTPDQYRVWYRMRWIVDNNPERFYKHIDKQGVEHTIDLYSPPNRLRDRWKLEMDDQEYKYIASKSTEIRSYISRANIEKRKINAEEGKTFADPTAKLLANSVELLELFGKYYNTEEVHKYVVEKLGIQVTLSTVRKFYTSYKEQIGRLRSQYDDDYSDISLHSKRARLGQLNYLLQDRRQIYDKTHKIEDSREIRAIIDQAKGEVEGNRLQLDLNGKIDVEVTLNIEHQLKMVSGLTLGQMIVSMTAGKLGVNANFLMERLANSVYNKFNGFKRNDIMLEEQPFKPSELVYDFNDIKQKNKEYEGGLNKLLYNQPIEDAKVIEDAKTIKQKLMERIKEKVDKSQIKETREQL